MLRGGLVESGLKLFEFRPDRFCCVKRFVASFFVARSESVLLTIVFDALMLCRNRDVPVPFQCVGLVGAPRVILLHVWITGICRSSH